MRCGIQCVQNIWSTHRTQHSSGTPLIDVCSQTPSWDASPCLLYIGTREHRFVLFNNCAMGMSKLPSNENVPKTVDMPKNVFSILFLNVYWPSSHRHTTLWLPASAFLPLPYSLSSSASPSSIFKPVLPFPGRLYHDPHPIPFSHRDGICPFSPIPNVKRTTPSWGVLRVNHRPRHQTPPTTVLTRKRHPSV